MSATNCLKCGSRGHLATNYVLWLYRCTNCRHEFEVEHDTCSFPGCASWVDDEESGRCWFHAAQIGIHPEKPEATRSDPVKSVPPGSPRHAIMPNLPAISWGDERRFPSISGMGTGQSSRSSYPFPQQGEPDEYHEEKIKPDGDNVPTFEAEVVEDEADDDEAVNDGLQIDNIIDVEARDVTDEENEDFDDVEEDEEYVADEYSGDVEDEYVGEEDEDEDREE